MPIHDWPRVPAGIFHHFHHTWIAELTRALNQGLLPPTFYALSEQVAGAVGPDVLTLHPTEPRTENGGSLTLPTVGRPNKIEGLSQGGVRVAERKPKVRFHGRTETDTYAAKAKAVVIRHTSGHDIIAMIEIVSPGNKSSQRRMNAFVSKAEEALAAGIHLLIADLFPPTPRDPEGIHRAIWQGRTDEFVFAADKPLTCVSYIGDPIPESFVEPVGVGDALPLMPLFLTPEVYVETPLETTYQSAWNAVPAVWRDALSGPGAP